MHDEHEKNAQKNSRSEDTPALIDRRSLLRGAAALTVGGLGAPVALAQVAGAPAAPSATSTAEPAPEPAGASRLDAQTSRIARWAGPAPGDWVRAHPGTDHDVVIVGGGQSGVAIAHGLRRMGVGRVEVIDQAEPGQAGIWRTIARMHQLRTPKTLMPGPEAGNVALSFRAWYETLNGAAAFDALDRIPRLAWADYLDWFQRATETNVRYRTRLLEIEPQGGVLRLHLESDGARRIETTRKLVLANGYAGAGGPNLPDFMRALPPAVWTHTTGRIPVETLRGKVVAVIGAGASAFDAAAVALEGGAKEVHLFNRRAYIDYQSPAAPAASRPAPTSSRPAPTPSDPAPTPSRSAPTSTRPAPSPSPVERGYPNVRELTYELPDVMRWRNFLLGDRRVASVPLDSLERAVDFKGFHIHMSTSLTDVAVGGNGKVAAKAGGRTMRFDYVIAGTGYRIDLAAQPELVRIHDSIALWRDRYRPQPGEENRAGEAHPYLGPGFEFQPREGTGAEYLRNIHCFNLAAELSFGVPVGDVPSMAYHPRLVAAIARDLYLESVDAAAHERYINAPLVPPDPAPYERAVEGRTREVA
ncbi:MAG TPA: FAD/NAD(P)-binding protein [Gammaproteobacteria bacterium]|nr:FAD/NAD(P)-binding protein [Gammaproteobacteria bacterium]